MEFSEEFKEDLRKLSRKITEEHEAKEKALWAKRRKIVMWAIPLSFLAGALITSLLIYFGVIPK